MERVESLVAICASFNRPYLRVSMFGRKIWPRSANPYRPTRPRRYLLYTAILSSDFVAMATRTTQWQFRPLRDAVNSTSSLVHLSAVCRRLIPAALWLYQSIIWHMRQICPKSNNFLCRCLHCLFPVHSVRWCHLKLSGSTYSKSLAYKYWNITEGPQQWTQHCSSRQ